MKKLYLFFTCCFAVASALSQSPITLGNANMPGSGDTLRYTDVSISSLGAYQQTGANYTWDFLDVTSTTSGLRSYKLGLLTPYAIFFLSPNDYGEKIIDTINVGLFKITNYYDFYKKSTSPNAFVADGAGLTFSSIPLPSFYSDKDELYNFPMTYPKHDSTTFRFSTLSTTLIPVRYSKTGHRVTTVDGWGTITTPYGTQNCLRLVTTQYSTDSVIASLGPIALPFAIPNNVRSYQWLTLTSKIPYLEVTGSLTGNNFTPTTARYRGYPQLYAGIEQQTAIPGLQLFPNPVKDKLFITHAGTGNLVVELLDVQGRLVKQATLNAAADQYVDVLGIEPGVYLAKISLGEKVNYLKFIKN